MRERIGALVTGGQRRVYLVAGVASLANGAALLLHILGGLPLPAMLAVCWTISVIAVAVIVRASGPAAGMHLRRRIGVGLVAALAATIAYDIAKVVLSTLDPSPYNPFEATLVFGTLLVGDGPPEPVVRAVGWAFHFANGATFGIGFSLLFGGASLRRSILLGIGWGIFLETFQLTLYPGWLDVRFLDEFRSISFLSHVVFGAVLGWLVHAGIRRTEDRAGTPPGTTRSAGIGAGRPR